jgi:hypothetical protein
MLLSFGIRALFYQFTDIFSSVLCMSLEQRVWKYTNFPQREKDSSQSPIACLAFGKKPFLVHPRRVSAPATYRLIALAGFKDWVLMNGSKAKELIQFF